MEAWIMACSFLLLGTAFALLAHKIAVWLGRASLLIFKVAPWLKLKHPEKDEDALFDLWNNSRWHIVETIWVWAMRILGSMVALAGAFLLYVLISQS